ncbi:MAG: N-acetyl-gamma-glutamyl-phosphate reductase, partial [Desulfovibrio sp.]|nr:N-acetyl-gamma-glutamyl-phosphate reductase [Desulfovibrio sp.]
MKKTRIGLVGITGYTGMELARLLATHPHMELSMACSRTESGKRLGAFYPFLEKLPGSDLAISVYNPDMAKEACDVVFLAVPHGKAMEMAGELVDRGVKVVDLSADFRIRDAAVYEAWYKVEHTRRDLLPKAVYGLPELYADEVRKAQLVANPGCYPTSAIL